MASEYVLGIDLGTSYFKAALFDMNGKMAGLGRSAVEKNTTSDSRCELLVDTFWQTLRNSIDQACKEAGANSDQIKAMGYSSQASSFILLDERGAPLTSLILWPDTRGGKLFKEVETLANHADFVHKTGIGIQITPGFMVNKLLWLKQNQPEVFAKAKSAMTISDYLTFCMTGEKVGDAGTASLLGVIDVENCCFWDEAFEILGLDKSLFSNHLRPGSLGGVVNETGRELLGVPVGIPFAVGSLDHYVAALGAGLGSIADASESTGTVLACVNSAESFKPEENMCVGPGFSEGSFSQLAFDGNGAVSLEWYRDNFASDKSVAQLIAEAEKVEPNPNLKAKPMAFAYSTKEEAFENITPDLKDGYFILALLNSTSETLKELIGELTGNKMDLNIVATGGGAKSDLWLKIKSQMLQSTFVRCDCDEPASRGAAILASVHASWFSDIYQASKKWVSLESKFSCF